MTASQRAALATWLAQRNRIDADRDQLPPDFTAELVAEFADDQKALAQLLEAYAVPNVRSVEQPAGPLTTSPTYDTFP